MEYKNAKQLLPQELLDQVQRYISGSVLYIPEKNPTKAGWGEKNGTRKKYQTRNQEIIGLYHRGISRQQLADKFHLSEHSIKKILEKK